MVSITSQEIQNPLEGCDCDCKNLLIEVLFPSDMIPDKIDVSRREQDASPLKIKGGGASSTPKLKKTNEGATPKSSSSTTTTTSRRTPTTVKPFSLSSSNRRKSKTPTGVHRIPTGYYQASTTPRTRTPKTKKQPSRASVSPFTTPPLGKKKIDFSSPNKAITESSTSSNKKRNGRIKDDMVPSEINVKKDENNLCGGEEHLDDTPSCPRQSNKLTTENEGSKNGEEPAKVVNAKEEEKSDLTGGEAAPKPSDATQKSFQRSSDDDDEPMTDKIKTEEDTIQVKDGKEETNCSGGMTAPEWLDDPQSCQGSPAGEGKTAEKNVVTEGASEVKDMMKEEINLTDDSEAAPKTSDEENAGPLMENVPPDASSDTEPPAKIPGEAPPSEVAPASEGTGVKSTAGMDSALATATKETPAEKSPVSEVQGEREGMDLAPAVETEPTAEEPPAENVPALELEAGDSTSVLDLMPAVPTAIPEAPKNEVDPSANTSDDVRKETDGSSNSRLVNLSTKAVASISEALKGEAHQDDNSSPSIKEEIKELSDIQDDSVPAASTSKEGEREYEASSPPKIQESTPEEIPVRQVKADEEEDLLSKVNEVETIAKDLTPTKELEQVDVPKISQEKNGREDEVEALKKTLQSNALLMSSMTQQLKNEERMAREKISQLEDRCSKLIKEMERKDQKSAKEIAKWKNKVDTLTMDLDAFKESEKTVPLVRMNVFAGLWKLIWNVIYFFVIKFPFDVAMTSLKWLLSLTLLGVIYSYHLQQHSMIPNLDNTPGVM